MTNWMHWRKMTWLAFAAATALLTWTIVGGANVVVSLVLSVIVMSVIGLLWFFSRPLWRQGHGLRLRRLATPAIEVRSYERLAKARGR